MRNGSAIVEYRQSRLYGIHCLAHSLSIFRVCALSKLLGIFAVIRVLSLVSEYLAAIMAVAFKRNGYI